MASISSRLITAIVFQLGSKVDQLPASKALSRHSEPWGNAWPEVSYLLTGVVRYDEANLRIVEDEVEWFQ
jgi:hypothetical protein